MKMRRLLQAAGALAVALALQPGAAMASSAAASIGTSGAGGASCFGSANGRVTNTCSGNRAWEMPTVINSTGPFTLTVNVTGTMLCGVFSAAQYGAVFYWENKSTSGNIAFSNVPVPVGGTLNARCGIPQNFFVNSINWN